MDGQRFDALAKGLAAGATRRRVLRGLGGAALAAAAGLRLPQRAKAAPAAPPEVEPFGGTAAWPACSPERPDYCVARFELGGVDQIGSVGDPSIGRTPGLVLWVLGSKDQSEYAEINRVEWSASTRFPDGTYNGRLDDALLDRDVVLVIRTGRLRPTFGSGTARDFFVDLAGDDEAGWVATITGRPALQQGTRSGGDPEQADSARVYFRGMASDLTAHNPGYPDGMFVATTASSASFPQWRDGAWLINLYAPHFAAPGTSPDGLTHGSYYAWLSPANLERMGLTPAQAAAGELAITRTEGAATTDLTASSGIRERAGGAYIEIPDITFSSPVIKMQKKGAGGGTGGGAVCRPRCRQGKVCKGGRCVRRRR